MGDFDVTAIGRVFVRDRDWEQYCLTCTARCEKSGSRSPALHFTMGTPRPYDHIYASSELEVRSCCYRTDWLEAGLSDHAAVGAGLSLAGSTLDNGQR